MLMPADSVLFGFSEQDSRNLVSQSNIGIAIERLILQMNTEIFI
jgi:hypothetical protein